MSKVLKVLALVLLVCAVGWAQTGPLGSIKGVVKDETGAVVPNATVIIISQATGQEIRRMSTGPAGEYNADLLPIGQYTVAIEAEGFSRTEAPGIAVRTTETTNVPLTLHLGPITTKITVTGAATPVQLSSPVMGQTITNVGNLPLPTRNFIGLLGLSSGAVTELSDTAALGRGNISLEVNGQRASQNNYTLEGINANDFNLPQLNNVPVPSPSAIAEFKTQTSLYDAAYGRNSGGNISAVLKSGTNKLHGDVFEFFRNDRLNANDFFLNSTGQSRPVLKQNIFGGSVGGPIPMTGAYFFLNYQGTRQRSGLATGTQLSNQIIALPTNRSAANLASVFNVPGGAAAINPVSLSLLNLQGTHYGSGLGGGFLIPSLAPTGVGPSGESTSLLAISTAGKYQDDNYVINLDRAIGSKDKFTGRWFSSENKGFRPFTSFTVQSMPQGQNNPARNRFLAVSETHVFGPNTVNEFRFGFNRFVFRFLPEELVTLADVGMTRPNSATFPGAPDFLITGTGFGFGTGVNDDRGGSFNTFEWTDTLSKTWGRHALRFGGSITRYQLNRFNNFATRGSLSFRSSPGLTSFQNFLLGNINNTQGGSGIFRFYFRNTDASAFIADEWKVTPRLTLNLGVRWEPFGISHEIYNHLTNLTGINDNLPAQYVFPEEFGPPLGTPGIKDCTYADCRDWNNVAPRFGFAWDPTGSARWAIRGGYGVYYSRFSNQTLLQSTGGSVFQQTLSSTGGSMVNPFPTLIPESQFPLTPTPIPQIVSIGNGGLGPVTFTGATPGFNFFGDRHLRTPYVQQWNFTVQRALGKDWLTEVGYVGNKGTALLFSNQGFEQAQLVNAANPLTVPTVNGPVTLTASTLSNINARVPGKFIGFPVGRLLPQTNDGASTYHSLQASLIRRFGNNYLQAAYTFSKSIDNASGSQADLGDELNGNLVWNGNQRLTRGVSDFDRPHRMVVSYSYEFPWFKNSGRLMRTVLGGWGSNAVLTFQSGIPFTVFDSAGGTMSGIDICCFATASIVPGRTVSNIKGTGSVEKRLDQYFDTTAFLPAPCVDNQLNIVDSSSPACEGTIIGNAGRNILRAPFQQNWDFSLFKRFYVTEVQNLEFRAEAFNMWNQVVFAAPGCGAGACSAPATDIESGPSAGRITATANRPRILQFVLKYNF